MRWRSIASTIRSPDRACRVGAKMTYLGRQRRGHRRQRGLQAVRGDHQGGDQGHAEAAGQAVGMAARARPEDPAGDPRRLRRLHRRCGREEAQHGKAVTATQHAVELAAALQARHGRILAADRRGVFRAGVEGADPRRRARGHRPRCRRQDRQRSRRTRWRNAPRPCSRARAGFRRSCARPPERG